MAAWRLPSHLPCFDIADVPAQRLVQQVGGVQARSTALGAGHVVAQCRSKVRVSALLHDALGALRGGPGHADRPARAQSR